MEGVAGVSTEKCRPGGLEKGMTVYGLVNVRRIQERFK